MSRRLAVLVIVFCLVILFLLVNFGKIKIIGFNVATPNLIKVDKTSGVKKIDKLIGPKQVEKTIEENLCIEDWKCTQYGPCVENFRSRNCVDLNNCGTSLNKPSEKISCATYFDKKNYELCSIRRVAWQGENGNKIERAIGGERVYLLVEVSKECLGANAKFTIYEDDIILQQKLENFNIEIDSTLIKIPYILKAPNDIEIFGLFGKEEELFFNVRIEYKEGNSYFFIDEKSSQILVVGEGPYTMLTGVCGNGVREGNEQCDDGNNNYGDRCTPACTIELSNLILNPSFEEGPLYWSFGQNGTFNISNDSANGLLSLFINCSGINANCYAQQINRTFNDSSQPIYFSVYMKPIELANEENVMLNIRRQYCGGSYIEGCYEFSSLSAKNSDLNKWVKKEFILYPIKPLEEIWHTLLILNGFGSAYFDNTHAIPLQQKNFAFDIGTTIVTFSEYGFLTSIKSKSDNKELLRVVNPISRLTNTQDFLGDKYSILLLPLGNNQYKVRYSNSNVEVRMSIEAKQNYIVFKILDVQNPDNETFDRISLITLETNNSPQRDRDWAYSASPNETFLYLNSISYDSGCSSHRTSINSFYYRCSAHKTSNLTNAAVVLVTAKKSEYNSVFANIASQENVPNVILEDGKWLRESKQLRENYLFADVNPSNYATLLNYSLLGNFKQFVVTNTFKFGPYRDINNYDTPDEFFQHMTQFQNSGIKTGIHTHINHLDYKEMRKTSFNFSNPPVDFKDMLLSFYLSNITENISTLNQIIPLSINPELNENFSYFIMAEGNPHFPPGAYGYDFAIGKEIINCKSYSGFYLTNCLRGQYDTAPKNHTAGSEVYILIMPPEFTEGLFYPNPKYKPLIDFMTDGFGGTIEALGGARKIGLIYLDGLQYPYLKGFIDSDFVNIQKLGVFPYLNKLDRLPRIFLGAPSDFSWFYQRVESHDGVTFKSKQFTRDHIIKNSVSLSNRFDKTYREVGWWKIHGSKLSDGMYDYDATSYDDVHYAFAKAVAYDTICSVQLEEFNLYQNHAMINDFFKLIGTYNNFIYEGPDSIVPQKIKDYLKDPKNEAELNNVSGYNFVKKKVEERYISLNDGTQFFDIINPFGEQKLILEIRPRPDFYSYNDSRNYLIFNFSSDNIVQKITSDSNIICNYANGNLTIINRGTTKRAGCGIKLPAIPENEMRFRRGIGISLTGDKKDEIVVVRLEHAYYGVRDYKFKVDFSGIRDLILADPTGDIYDYDEPNGNRVDWYGGAERPRHWTFNYASRIPAVYIFVTNIPPGNNVTLQLHSLKALREKAFNGTASSSQLVSPSIIIRKDNDVVLTFNETLTYQTTRDYLLSFDENTQNYTIYSPNYEEIKTRKRGIVSGGNLTLSKGINRFVFTVDSQNSNYSGRAEVKIIMYDDEDNDKIPTDGNFDSEYFPCNGTRNFCDDNCPLVYNPDQRDSDRDGLGDACDTSSDNRSDNRSNGGGGQDGDSGNNNNRSDNCTPSWRCTDWSDCVDGQQNRICFDANNCNRSARERNETRQCGAPPPENESDTNQSDEEEREDEPRKNRKNFVSSLLEQIKKPKVIIITLIVYLIFIGGIAAIYYLLKKQKGNINNLPK